MKCDLSNPDYLAFLEVEIMERYGKETMVNFRTNWDETKEKAYLAQLKTIETDKEDTPTSENSENVALGVFISKKLFMAEATARRVCAQCSKFSVKRTDALYFQKFGCCFACYIQFVEGREERWLMRREDKEK